MPRNKITLSPRDRVLKRLWEIAETSPELTRNSLTGQLKAMAMIVAIEEIIPLHNKTAPTQKPPTLPTYVEIYKSLPQRQLEQRQLEQRHLEEREQLANDHSASENLVASAPPPVPAESVQVATPTPSPTPDPPQSSRYTSMVPDARLPFWQLDQPKNRRR